MWDLNSIVLCCLSHYLCSLILSCLLFLFISLSFCSLSVSEPVTITVGQTGEQQLSSNNNTVQSQDTITEEKTSPQTEQESDLFDAAVDSPDSGPHKGEASGEEGRRRRRTSSIRKTVMWVITEDNR